MFITWNKRGSFDIVTCNSLLPARRHTSRNGNVQLPTDTGKESEPTPRIARHDLRQWGTQVTRYKPHVLHSSYHNTEPMSLPLNKYCLNEKGYTRHHNVQNAAPFSPTKNVEESDHVFILVIFWVPGNFVVFDISFIGGDIYLLFKARRRKSGQHDGCGHRTMCTLVMYTAQREKRL